MDLTKHTKRDKTTMQNETDSIIFKNKKILFEILKHFSIKLNATAYPVSYNCAVILKLRTAK